MPAAMFRAAPFVREITLKTFNRRHANGPWEDLENNAPSATSQSTQANPQEQSFLRSLPMPPKAVKTRPVQTPRRVKPITDKVQWYSARDVDNAPFLEPDSDPEIDVERRTRKTAKQYIRSIVPDDSVKTSPLQRYDREVSPETQQRLGIHHDGTSWQLTEDEHGHHDAGLRGGSLAHLTAKQIIEFPGGERHELSELLRTPDVSVKSRPSGLLVPLGAEHTVSESGVRSPIIKGGLKFSIATPHLDMSHVATKATLRASNLMKTPDLSPTEVLRRFRRIGIAGHATAHGINFRPGTTAPKWEESNVEPRRVEVGVRTILDNIAQAGGTLVRPTAQVQRLFNTGTFLHCHCPSCVLEQNHTPEAMMHDASAHLASSTSTDPLERSVYKANWKRNDQLGRTLTVAPHTSYALTTGAQRVILSAYQGVQRTPFPALAAAPRGRITPKLL